MTSTQVKNRVRDRVERGFDKLHKIADVVTFPLAPLDGAIHGTARGISNWLLDRHPEHRSHERCRNDGSWPQNCHPQPQCYPPPPQQQGYPGYRSGNPSGNGLPGMQNIHGISNRTGNNKGDNNGSVKVGNFGGS